MKKFRLPRKVKKKLTGKLWLYPKDDRNCRRLGFPKYSQEDYDAVKQGICVDALKEIKK